MHGCKCIVELHVMFFIIFFLFFISIVYNNWYTIIGPRIDGLLPTWQPAIIYRPLH